MRFHTVPSQYLPNGGQVDSMAGLVWTKSDQAGAAVVIPKFDNLRNNDSHVVTVVNLGSVDVVVRVDGATINGQASINVAPSSSTTIGSIPNQQPGTAIEYGLISAGVGPVG